MAGFPLLLVLVTLFPAYMQPPNTNADPCALSSEFSCPEPKARVEMAGSTMEFLPLMLTSVYCAIGLVWGFLRLMFIYLNEETTYQGQLSSLK
jgi:alpha-1,3-glucosyltransferase